MIQHWQRWAVGVTVAVLGVNLCGDVPTFVAAPVVIAGIGMVSILGLAVAGRGLRRGLVAIGVAMGLIAASVPVGGRLLRVREGWTRAAVEDAVAAPTGGGCASRFPPWLLSVTCTKREDGVEYAYYSPARGWCLATTGAPGVWDCVVED